MKSLNGNQVSRLRKWIWSKAVLPKDDASYELGDWGTQIEKGGPESTRGWYGLWETFWENP